MTSPPPFGIEESVEHLASLNREHERATTPIQRVANRATNVLSRPGTLAIIVMLIILWICGNYVAQRLGIHALEEFPFPDLAFVATIAALLIAILILTTQRHQDQLAERRSQLTLQIAILSERKVAKVIALLEEQRRESPLLSSRIDEEAEAMAKSANPQDTLRSLDQAP